MPLSARTLALSITFGLATSSLWADQTSHVNGMHDKSPSHFAFTHATLHLEPGKTLKNATLVINHGRIVSISEDNNVPEGATEIDLSNHSVYSGFIDPYSDFTFGSEESDANFDDPPKYSTDRSGGKAWNDAIHAEIKWSQHYKPDTKSAEGLIANGFTSVQTAKLDGIFQGQGVTVSLGEGSAAEQVYVANARHFGSFNKGSSKQTYPTSLMGSLALIRQTLSDAQWYINAKGKIDVLNTGERVEYNAALEQLSAIQSTGLMFNPDDSLSTLRADKLFSSYNTPVNYLADGFEYARINDIRTIKAGFVVPVNFPDAPKTRSFEEQLDVSLSELRHWERAPGNASVLAHHKIPFAFTQSGLKNKDSFWKQIRLTIKHGLSEDDALKALTITPAKMAGLEELAGKIQTGYLADLVITDGNIFKNGKINSVWLRGKEKIILPMNKPDFNGQFDIELDQVKLALQLTEKENVSGKLALETIESEIKVHQHIDNFISFSAVHPNKDIATTLRFSARLINDQLKGYVLFENDNRISFVADKKALADEKETSTESEDKEQTLSYLSKLTYPNQAYGLEQSPINQNLHIKNATIWTSEDSGVLTHSDLIIQDGKIRQIGQQLKTPRGFNVIDATDKHVTAGIIDEHSHIAISKGVNESSDAVTAEVSIGDVVDPEDISIFRSLAGGTTTAQLLHGSANPIGGQAQIIKLRWGENAESMKFENAPGSIKFALGENVKQANWGDKFSIRYPQTRMGVDTVVRDAFTRALDYRRSWQAYKDLSRNEKKANAPPRKDFRMETILEILDKKRFVHSHSYVASEILSLMTIAEDFGFTIQTFTHILEGYKVADEMAQHGASASTFADWWAYKFEVYDALPMNTCMMMDRGVLVSVNSDSNDLIRRLNTEAAKSINYCGMSQENAWKMVTINPAKQLKIDQFTGSLKTGKNADFVIWSGNPLSIYSKVEQTWIDGKKYFDRTEELIARKLLTTEKNQLIQKVLSEQNGSNPKNSRKDKEDESPHDSDRWLKKNNATWQCDHDMDYWKFVNTQKRQTSAFFGAH